AAISLAFSEQGSHLVIALNTLLVTLFLAIEVRRYRYYELWSYRVRLMETDFFASMLVPPFKPAPDWAESLAENLLHPDFPVSWWEAFGRRYRRNYVWVYAILALAWLTKVALHPTPVSTWAEVIERSSVGSLPGAVVMGVGVVFNLALLLIGLFTIGLAQASGEVLPRFGVHAPQDPDHPSGMRAWFRPSRKRQQVLALVVTDHPDEVGKRVLDLKRGVTSLAGVGLFTGAARSVLLTALTVTEVPLLKTAVRETDPHAFVIISPAREILGSGFLPLDAPQPE
ncbi:MAG: DUF2270 domain-containing protein, partial [Candidatus Eremiobacterota bacterium]